MADTTFPDYSTAGGYVAGQVESTGGGYVPNANQLEPYTQAPNFEYKGGYDPDAIGSTGGGYDPNNPSYGNQANSIGGDVAVSKNYEGAPSYAGGYYGDQVEEGGGGYDPSVAGLEDSKNARLAASGLKEGGATGDPAADPSVAYQSQTGENGEASSTPSDWRVRVSLGNSASILYKDPSNLNTLMKPLVDTNGVIFPYTPNITVVHSANYTPVNPTHSNYPMHFYNNSEVSDITITGEFTVQSIEEGQYLMAAIYFFRSATKMFFGQGRNVGNPPPIVFLDGYGSHYFPHVPCVVSSFQHQMSDQVDYIQIPVITTTLEEVDVQLDNQNIGHVQLTDEEQKYVPGLLKSTPAQQKRKQMAYQHMTSYSRVPTASSLTITLKPVYSRRNLHNRFDYDKFAQGQLLQDKLTGLGGFI